MTAARRPRLHKYPIGYSVAVLLISDMCVRDETFGAMF